MKYWLTLAMIIVVAGLGPAKAHAAGAPPAKGLSDLRTGLQAYQDLYHLCFWHDGLRAGQISSHDEQNRNIDLGHFHGVYKGGQVLAKIQGPGVIYRVWSAGPSGTLYFWADDAEEPVVSCGFKDYLTGECYADQAFAVGRYTNYTPFYFEKSLIVTAKKFKLEAAYYQISYMTYDIDPGLKTMTAEGVSAYPEDLAAAKKFWNSAGKDPARDPGGAARTMPELFDLPPGGKKVIEIPGAGMVTELWVGDHDDFAGTLEDVRMRIHWDHQAEPAVDSAVDAFFGNRFDSRKESQSGPYETIAVSALEQGYVSRWPMPFANGMLMVFENHGDKTRRIKVEMQYRALAGLPRSAMRFHALYREQDYPDLLSKDKLEGLSYQVDQNTNYVLLDRRGMGWYVGCFLYVASLGTEWWGEGDEMIWVDGDDQALIRGTGTEDEFNWSYGFKENRSPVSGALQVAHMKGNAPQTTIDYNVLYRFRPGDFIPFRENIKVTYERLGSTTKWMKRYPGSLVNVSHFRGDDYRSVAYWYELPAY